jgi:diguanylate cyclase (GGDEF)-like protein
MGAFTADTTSLVDTQSLVLALCACLALGVVLYVRLSRSRKRLKSRLLAANSRLDAMRGRDGLTGLMTRPEFESVLDEAVLACNRTGQSLAVLYLGLDNFRFVNEAYGLRVGDTLLVQAAQRIAAVVGGGPAASRMGSDEFALLLAGGLAEADAAATALQDCLQAPFDVEALSLRMSASVGVAIYPEHGSRPRLLAHAALAMRSVKLGGGACHAHFDPAMAVNLRDQAEMLQDLRHALERGELELYYQPKVDAKSQLVTAAEALMRWKHPRRGMVSPAVFIPLAERHGLIVALGQWVIDEACRQAGVWRQRGLRMRVAINISGHQLRQDDLVEKIQAALQRHGIPPARLTCEITETVAMEDTHHTRAAFDRLRSAGLHVSIDDFGTGHSSLASLRRLPAAELKIDGAFVSDLASSREAQTIVQAIVQMAHTLDMRVVAEGVETESQRDMLVKLGCDELQGYLFARPMSATALALYADNEGQSTAPNGTVGFRASLFDPTAPAALLD